MTISIGDTAPHFSLFDQHGEKVSIGNYRGKKVVLAFFPAAFTSVCKNEMCTFRDSLSGLNDSNAEVLAVSVDGRFANAEFAKQNNLSFPVLSDYERSAVKAYGVELENFAGMGGYLAARRSVFIIDGDGIVQWVWLSDVPTNEPPYEEIKAVTKR